MTAAPRNGRLNGTAVRLSKGMRCVMARTLEDLYQELQSLRAEVEELKRREAARGAMLRALADCFPIDGEWERLRGEEEERQRRLWYEQQREAERITKLRQMAGCFKDDPEWAAIHDEIERQRKEPDPNPE